MKLTKEYLKKVVTQELKTVLKEEQEMTSQEKQLDGYVTAMKLWGKKLTPVKYREIEQTVAAVFGTSDPVYKNFILAANNAVENKGTAKDAIFLDGISKGEKYGQRLKNLLKNSGYMNADDINSAQTSFGEPSEFSKSVSKKPHAVKKQEKPWYKRIFN